MTSAMRIMDNVEIALSEDFLASDIPSDLGAQLPASAMESCFGEMSLAGFDILVPETMKNHERYDTGMDVSMAVGLHKALPLSRRQAADMRFWAWLGIVHMPDFVAWRWKPAGGAGKRVKERFYGDRVRQTFSRLWWAAELTRNGDDYTLTMELLNHPGFQNNYEAIFGRAFGSYFPAMEIFITKIKGKKEKFIEQFAKELGFALTTSVLETMNKDDLDVFLDNIAQKI